MSCSLSEVERFPVIEAQLSQKEMAEVSLLIPQMSVCVFSV